MSMMYDTSHVRWLALYLRENRSPLCHRKLWNTGKARAIASGLRVCALDMDRESALCMQS